MASGVTVLAIVGLSAMPASAATNAGSAPAAPTGQVGTYTGANGVTAVDLCPKALPGYEECDALKRTDPLAADESPGRPGSPQPTVSPALQGNNGGYSPVFLQSAYDAPSTTGGVGETVAIVDAFDDPNAESDLTFYRSFWQLPACTTANGCFSKVNETGGTTYPTPDAGWAGEISLDLDMVSALCPNCHILLVEAASNETNDLGESVDEAVALGANVVSNSYGAPEFADESEFDSDYTHPGVAITASAGDSGYGASYPATSTGVTAVGGTTLEQLTASGTRDATETVWEGAGDPAHNNGGTGSGCSAYESKPSWQRDSGCTNRIETDVSAEADPATGVWTYDTYGGGSWGISGGTSAGAPMIGAMYALAGHAPASTQMNSLPYADPGALNDVTSGTNSATGCAPTYLCTAGVGYDGPTGLGTPNGVASFAPPTTATVPGAPTGLSGSPTTLSVLLNWTAPASTGGSPVLGYDVYEGSTPGGESSVPINGTTLVSGTSFTANGLNTGTRYYFEVKAINAKGGSSPSSEDAATTASVAPTVTGVSPASGPAAGGTTVTITGSNFNGATKVLIGTVAATSFSVVSSTQITAVSPAQAAATHNVFVTTPGGTSAAVAADSFTYVASIPPSISGLNPTSGPVNGGTTVTINGANFTGATKVLFGTVAATSFNVVSSSQITAVSPAQAAATHNVFVTTPAGTSATVSADSFIYTAAKPAVSGVSPTSGPLTGGTVVTIAGSNFGGTTSVLFGTVAATSFTVVSATQIAAVSPAQAATTHNVFVTTPAGTSAAVPADSFTYVVATPAVTGINPNSGPIAGGTTVTIIGTSFTGATKVLFGTVAATSFTVVSATQIAAVSPAQAATTHNVFVTTPSGTSAGVTADSFTYTAAKPAVTAVSPASGPSSGGTLVTITGTNFGGTTSVLFGAVAATSFTVISSTEIQAVAPAQSAATHNVYVFTPNGQSAAVAADSYVYA
ncbi:MAG TPA: IPT/TIG domain-containing protein [Acidimicrobiales bacterium]|nr:IPT/TIG domain-containing protein [Acidimicrobiales bacterium]